MSVYDDPSLECDSLAQSHTCSEAKKGNESNGMRAESPVEGPRRRSRDVSHVVIGVVLASLCGWAAAVVVLHGGVFGDGSLMFCAIWRFRQATGMLTRGARA